MKSIKEWFEWAQEQVYENGDKIYPWADKALELCTTPEGKANSLTNALLGAFPFIVTDEYDWYKIYTGLETQII